MALQYLSCFRYPVWCTNPSSIPATRDLWIVELVQVIEGNIRKTIALSYPITIRFSLSFAERLRSHSSPPTDDLDDGAQDHDHHGL